MAESYNIAESHTLRRNAQWEQYSDDIYRLFFSTEKYIHLHVPSNKSVKVTATIKSYCIDEKRPGNVKDIETIVKVKFDNDPDIETVKRKAICIACRITVAVITSQSPQTKSRRGRSLTNSRRLLPVLS